MRRGDFDRGGPGRIRTCDARFRKPTLYPLSYEAVARVDNRVKKRVKNLVPPALAR